MEPFREHGFPGTALTLAMAAEIREPGRDIGLLEDIGKIAAIEFQLVALLRVRTDLVAFFDQPMLFGETVATRFPEAQHDVSEAGNCYALGLNTAAVFHLMRVMEVQLKAVASELGSPDPVKDAERNWGAILRKVRARLDALNNDPASKDRIEFHAEVYTLLGAVKIAWRNPVMHVEAKHDEQDARRILDAVKGFAQYLASGLTPAA